MNREDDPQLWDLLGAAQVPEPSPFFARNVLREIRDSPTTLPWRARLRSRRILIPTFAAAAALMITVAIVRYQPQRSSTAVAVKKELQAAFVAPEVPPAPAVWEPVAPSSVASQPVAPENATVEAVNLQADEPVVADMKLLAEADDESDDDVLSL